jgi:hypothetical protein
MSEKYASSGCSRIVLPSITLNGQSSQSKINVLLAIFTEVLWEFPQYYQENYVSNRPHY